MLSATIIFGVLLPVVLFYERRRINAIDNLIVQAYKNGTVVTAYIGARKTYPGQKDSEQIAMRKPRQSAKYYYFVGGSCDKFWTHTYTGSKLPDNMMLYVDAKNPHKYIDEFTRLHVGIRPLPIILICLLFIPIFRCIYSILWGFLCQ